MEIKITPTRRALITGINGQDGALLAEFLLDKDYVVYGLRRRTSQNTTHNIKHLLDRSALILRYGDMTDSASITKIIEEAQPDEVYNLAAQSHVGISFDTPVDTGNITGLGPVRILEALKTLGLLSTTRFYQASTSEMFGLAIQGGKQSESTIFNPKSPYAIAKHYAHNMTKYYRYTYDAFAVCGILFNHESKTRGENFVTRKIAKAVAAISNGSQTCLHLGNLNAMRDWGHAKEYVEAMWLMLQQDEPRDYVIATGKTHSVREFVEEAFKAVDMQISWYGKGDQEEGFCGHDRVVAIDKKLYRPVEVDFLCGNASKAEMELGWRAKITMPQLAEEMVRAEVGALGNKYRRVLDELRLSQQHVG